MKITPIIHILSILIMPLAGFMIISGLVDLFYSNVNWINFLSSAIITLFIGMSVFLATKTNRDQKFRLKTSIYSNNLILDNNSYIWSNSILFKQYQLRFHKLPFLNPCLVLQQQDLQLFQT